MIIPIYIYIYTYIHTYIYIYIYHIPTHAHFVYSRVNFRGCLAHVQATNYISISIYIERENTHTYI